ncbi:pentatricopeptide repeat-containing protein 2, mitochondrial [Diachasma alloeum]|uniref:pentatricopeptide repeat-containing protein 2, mitochondrial n=1 Tax=Diachasma alloeum TaxID=454923 RepID=UPI00073810DD|nr:pentatricopeptide repeat-containing protein 2, mitochondrial [Diachasma alloeum]
MAGTMKCFSRLSLGLFNNNVNRQILLNGNRALYTETSLGLPEYKNSRASYQDRYRSSLEAFKEKVTTNVNDEKSLIFTEDLKALLHVVEKSPDDINLLKTALEKFNSQDNDIRFGTFKFGPVVMRAFHYLNEPNVALETFRNPKFETFYDQQTTFAILVDLLHENGMYKEVREVYDLIRSKFSSGIRNPKLVISVLALSCYKENTKESLDFGVKVCKEMIERGAVPLRKVITTLGALALKQNAPHIALELMSVCRKSDYISVRTVRAMALCDLDRLDDIAHDFQITLKRGIPTKNKYFSNVAPKVEAAIQRGNISPNAEICELFELIKARDFIDEKTLEEHISEPLESSKGPAQQYQYQESRGWSQPKRQPEQWTRTPRGSAEKQEGYNQRFNNF